MSITTLNSKNTITNKISLLNDMIKEVNGKTVQGLFNEYELTQLFADSGIDRKFLRNVSLGHTLSTYAGWTHLQTEVGYSIWKYSPTNYAYNSNNTLYLDDIVLTNKGQATSESATVFDYVYLYNGDSGAGYTDNTTEAGVESGTEFSSLDSINDYLYIGDANVFNGIKFEFHTRGSGYTIKVEYYNGDWVELTSNTNTLVDDTSNFESDGNISWDIISDWATTTIDSQTAYWIRISTTSAPATVAKIYLAIPSDSVIGLLALSSDKILGEEWTWCSYNTSIYVAIRNTGNSSYEGDYFIASGSSTTNKQNFFIYNHEFKLDHQDSSYDSVKVITTDTILSNESVVIINTTSGSVTVTLPTAVGNEGKRFIIKAAPLESGTQAIIDAYQQETIDLARTYTFTADNQVRTLVSDGTNWWIIGN